MKEGFINIGENDCRFPPPGKMTWRIISDSNFSGEEVAQIHTAMNRYRDVLGVPIENVPGDDDSAYLSFMGKHLAIIGDPAAGVIMNYMPGRQTVTTAGGGERGLAQIIRNARVYLSPNIDWTPEQVGAAACHEGGHAMGLGHNRATNTCMNNLIGGIRLTLLEQRRLKAVDYTSNGDYVITPAVPGDNGEN
jgi:hypothetical protein